MTRVGGGCQRARGQRNSSGVYRLVGRTLGYWMRAPSKQEWALEESCGEELMVAGMSDSTRVESEDQGGGVWSSS